MLTIDIRSGNAVFTYYDGLGGMVTLACNDTYKEIGTNYVAQVIDMHGNGEVTLRKFDLAFPNADFVVTCPVNKFLKEYIKIELYNSKPQEKQEVKPACDCGGHKIGLKDYARGHYDFCKVYKAW